MRLVSLILLRGTMICSSLSATTVVKNFSELVRGGKSAQAAIYQEVTSHPIVIIKCTMKNCAPCKAISPQFEALATKYRGLASCIELDVHLFDDVIRPYAIKKAPSFILFYHARHAKTFHGSDAFMEIAPHIEAYLKRDLSKA